MKKFFKEVYSNKLEESAKLKVSLERTQYVSKFNSLLEEKGIATLVDLSEEELKSFLSELNGLELDSTLVEKSCELHSEEEEETYEETCEDEPCEEGELNEEDKITSKEEFEEYAMTVLKKAFKEDFDEEKAKELVDGISNKVGDDWGQAVGILTSSLGS